MIDEHRSSADVRIVALSARRIPEFARLLDAVARERRWLAMTEAPALEDVMHFVLESLARGGIHLAALHRGELVGWCDIRRPHRSGAAHVGQLGMGVATTWRGRGLGRRLLEEAAHRAEAAGIERIELEVFASNEAAQGLYESAGFVVEGIRRDAWRLDDWRDDIVLMARRRANSQET